MLNYRNSSVWDLLVQDVFEWTRIRDGDGSAESVDGIILEEIDLLPNLLEPDLAELMRKDSDSDFHYSFDEILSAHIVVKTKRQNRLLGYYGTKAAQDYPNPLLVKLTRTIWNSSPANHRFIFIGEVPTKMRVGSSANNPKMGWIHPRSIISSGIVPYCRQLSDILASAIKPEYSSQQRVDKFSPGIPAEFLSSSVSDSNDDNADDHNAARTADLSWNTSKMLAEWYSKYPSAPSLSFTESSSDKYPANCQLVYPSSNHVIPYPIIRFGMGSFAYASLLFMLRENPLTYVGELEGSRSRVDISNGRLILEKETMSKFHIEELKRHYQTRFALRKKYPEFNANAPLEVMTARNFNKQELDSIFTFARYSTEDMNAPAKPRSNVFDVFPSRRSQVTKSKAARNIFICAVNLTGEDQQFYIDMSRLGTGAVSKPNERSLGLIGDGEFYQLSDLLNPQVRRMNFSSKELLHEKNHVHLHSYSSLLWRATRIPGGTQTERIVLEDSISRLQKKISNPNVTFEELEFNHFFELIVSKFVEISNGICTLEQLRDYLSSKVLTLIPPDSETDRLLPGLIHEILLIASRPGSVRAVSQQLIYDTLLKLSRDTSHKNVSEMGKKILQHNKVGPLIFITPEIAPWSTIGGIGIMVDELTQDLAKLGLDIRVISPYYNFDRDGKTGYLSGAKHLINFDTWVDGEHVVIGLHHIHKNAVDYYFMHNFTYFPAPYGTGSPEYQLKMIVVMAKASLELMCQLRILPAIVISNDWFTGLVPGYAKCGEFGSTFNGTTFFHLIHNLEEGYQGLIWPETGSMYTMRRIHGLPEGLVVDYESAPNVINSSRCALLTSDQWGTVSASYRDDLLRGSPFSPLLHRFPKPFAHSNGIRVGKRRDVLAKIATSHAEAKELLQKTYFGFSDPSIPVFSFVGRITVQKGVHLILEAAKVLIDMFEGRVQIIIGGMANPKEKYSAHCAWMMNSLRQTYPRNFWADPDHYFVHGALTNFGSDFGLMPSLFEPSGVVQQEYFVAGTPVIAFWTGGLKDTVFEFHQGKGNGFVFLSHQHGDFVYAVRRAIAVFHNAEQYGLLRQNAKSSVLDTFIVAKAWGREFFDLRHRIWPFDVVSSIDENSATDAQ